tara:strand:- start:216 stop:1256 length:1041 start_codon:yes stop_codon:yes gene_type:complete
MGDGAARKSSWPMRLAIVGALLLVIGSIIVAAQDEALDSVYDPRENAITQIKGPGSANFDVQKGDCYMAIFLEDEDDMDITLRPIIDVTHASTEELTPNSCFSDWRPMASDGTEFEIHEQWIAEESGQMLVESTCPDEGCEEQTVWIVHTDGWELKMLESSGLIFGFGICCLGFILLPIAGVVAYTTRSNRIHGALRVIGRDGELLKSFESQEEMMAAMRGVNIPLEGDIADEDIGEISEPDDGFVDGSKDVMQGTLMTTEQVYALMRGDTPDAVREVQDPFADSPTPIQQQPLKKKLANISEISDWDTGGESDGVKTTDRPANSKTKELKGKKTESKDWNVWDDM